jgi:hypothetical protein
MFAGPAVSSSDFVANAGPAVSSSDSVPRAGPVPGHLRSEKSGKSDIFFSKLPCVNFPVGHPKKTKNIDFKS